MHDKNSIHIRQKYKLHMCKGCYKSLYIPHVSKLEIAEEHEYQVDLYFDTVIEPKIEYTYPNQY